MLRWMLCWAGLNVQRALSATAEIGFDFVEADGCDRLASEF
jgi:hypothetical protein